MAKLVVEHHPEGGVYVMEETDSHYRKVNRKAWTKRVLEDCPIECCLAPDEYFVIDLVEVD